MISMIENFGKNVARLRKENGMTQEELAEKIDVKKQTISNIERGERYPTFENLEKISQILNANAIQLFGTPNEIAVSDTPVILNKIDEYNGKIQTLLKVENLLKDEFFKNEVDKVAKDIQIITDFTKTKSVVDENGEQVVDSNYRLRRRKPAIEAFPFDKIAKAREDIEFILANKDKI